MLSSDDNSHYSTVSQNVRHSVKRNGPRSAVQGARGPRCPRWVDFHQMSKLHNARGARRALKIPNLTGKNVMATKEATKESQLTNALSTSKKDFYTCRKCGTQLFSKENARVLHEGNQASSSPSSRSSQTSGAVSGIKAAWRRGDMRDNTSHCSSVFLMEAPDWAADITGNDGRFACPNCSARIGSFSWSGATCSCGRWVTPSFQFQLSRVDARSEVSVLDLIPEWKVQAELLQPSSIRRVEQ